MNKKALSVMTATSMVWCGYSHAELLGCLIEPDRVADVGSQSTGVIDKITVERGDMVTAGQVVARLSAQVERASVSVAEVKARAEAEAQQAQAAYELAQRKLERTKDLVKRDFVSDQALDQAEAEARVAQQRVEQAREAQRVSQREYHLSNAQLSQRDVRSPFAGLVVERYRTEGERIEREPLVRVARIDPLRIEAIVPAPQFGSIRAGQSATIKTDLPDFAVLSAQVTLVDRVVDPASNSFRVRLSMPNPGNRIPSGLRCRIAFNASGAPPAGSAPVAPVPAPATAGQVAPARWQQEVAPIRPRVVQVAMAHQAAVPAKPMRFLSSTLKIAMAELGRSSPGGRYSGALVLAEASNLRKPVAYKPRVMAMSYLLPSLDAGAAEPVVAMADARKVATPPERQPVAVTGLRLASVR